MFDTQQARLAQAIGDDFMCACEAAEFDEPTTARATAIVYVTAAHLVQAGLTGADAVDAFAMMIRQQAPVMIKGLEKAYAR
jgi:hypothetical protein